MVGANQMAILTAAHNFSGAPRDAALTVEFYVWSSDQVALRESLNARILASDRSFKQTDDVAFLVIDLPSDQFGPRSFGNERFRRGISRVHPIRTNRLCGIFGW